MLVSNSLVRPPGKVCLSLKPIFVPFFFLCFLFFFFKWVDWVGGVLLCSCGCSSQVLLLLLLECRTKFHLRKCSPESVCHGNVIMIVSILTFHRNVITIVSVLTCHRNVVMIVSILTFHKNVIMIVSVLVCHGNVVLIVSILTFHGNVIMIQPILSCDGNVVMIVSTPTFHANVIMTLFLPLMEEGWVGWGWQTWLTAQSFRKACLKCVYMNMVKRSCSWALLQVNDVLCVLLAVHCLAEQRRQLLNNKNLKQEWNC